MQHNCLNTGPSKHITSYLQKNLRKINLSKMSGENDIVEQSLVDDDGEENPKSTKAQSKKSAKQKQKQEKSDKPTTTTR